MFPIRRLLLAACLSSAAVCVPAQSATAQSGLPACPPPASNEYLLLVRGETEAERAEIADILPIESAVLICQYTDEVLVRAGGFTSLETANAWATYMESEQGFESFVSQPASQPVPNNGDGAVNGNASVGYQPNLLGSGYAVLVEYGTRPEVATAVGQLVRPVGLAVYQQRAYLLAGYTSDGAAASAILQRLSDAQLAAVIVDAQQVVRLSNEVAR